MALQIESKKKERTTKILIVDDRLENLIALERLLAWPDIECMRAFSGNDALKLTLHHDFALAIIDVQMPDMDGYETVELMRSAKRTKYLPVIFVSAIYQEDFHIIKGIETGAVDFISKPIIPEILKGKVRVFLELFQQKQLLAELLHEKEQINQALHEAKEKAELATKTKSIFLANMSHEIRTPLNGVIGLTNILAKTKLNEEQKELVDMVISSGENLLSIINDVLDFSKIEAGQVKIEKNTFSLLCELGKVIKTMQFNANIKGINLLQSLDDNLPRYISSDPVRLKQILINLINNAIKFTQKGHVKLTCKPIEDKNPMLRFEIQDTGIGISAEAIEKLFKEFSQADSTTTRRFGGTGLGLAISKNLVNLMGGSIGVESEPEKGSVFWFEIPYEIAEKPEKKEAKKNNLSFNTNIKILLAEDNPINQKVAFHSLRQLGLTCDLAINGKEAVAKHAENHYDLILMDVQMPEMDGLEASRIIRSSQAKNPSEKPVIIAALTANAFKEDKNNCLEAGMNYYLSKPFKPNELIELISSL
ncbi:MAG: hybrid sensor histidine kinase/response regulator [Bacteroidetes bacterium HGW-Bacteroidetes-1]|jgi:signal transduction histidine kinase|nr:MAG: hybrid sensor histidine kinase/response regulator [Bacteroidetes bacterium HGW-Bacteroidetes-1]